MNPADPRPAPQPTAPAPQTADEFWKGTCIGCAHEAHPLMACRELIPNGDPSNGPAYCPCADQLEFMEAEIRRLRKLVEAGESAPPTSPRPHNLRDAVAEVKFRGITNGWEAAVDACLQAVDEWWAAHIPDRLTPCPLCPHWMHLHEADGSCGGGCH